MMPDHVHIMLVAIPLKISISSSMGYHKGKSSLMIFDQYANLKYKYGNRKFWEEGYAIGNTWVEPTLQATCYTGGFDFFTVSSFIN